MDNLKRDTKNIDEMHNFEILNTKAYKLYERAYK